MKLDIQLFASTNKTTHYNLSQYVSSDKPTYLVDYNDDMSAIDTAIYGAKTQADLGVTNASTAQSTAENAQTTANTAVTNAGTAQSTANANSVKIGELANLTTTNKSDVISAINENVTNISDTADRVGVLSNLTTNVKTNTVNAINEVNGEVLKFNLTEFKSVSAISSTFGTVSGVINSATNSDGSIGKVYGNFVISNTASQSQNTATVTIAGLNFAPDSSFTVNSLGIRQGNSGKLVRAVDVVFNTNGSITITLPILAGDTSTYVQVFPCMIFAKDFGDVSQ